LERLTAVVAANVSPSCDAAVNHVIHQGNVIQAHLDGCIQMKSFLAGSPGNHTDVI